MQKYSLEVWTDKCEWERMGLFDTYAAARDEGRDYFAVGLTLVILILLRSKYRIRWKI